MRTKESWRCWVVPALLMAQAAAGAVAGTTLHVDPNQSHVVIAVGKAGAFGFAGHVHEVRAPEVRGVVTFDVGDWQASTVSLEFAAGALQVTGKGEPPADVPEVQRVMLSERVLDASRYPTVTFRSRRLSATSSTTASANLQIEGDLTLHGVTRPVSVLARVTVDPTGTVTARGAFSFKQSDFGIQPVTAAGGTIRVKDVLDVEFEIRAVR